MGSGLALAGIGLCLWFLASGVILDSGTLRSCLGFCSRSGSGFTQEELLTVAGLDWTAVCSASSMHLQQVSGYEKKTLIR